jgi:hypothetical protein
MDSLQTILFLGANPKDTVRKRLDQEFRDISDGLERAQKREQFDLQQKWAVRPRDIQRAMLDVKPQIVHFSGNSENGLIFEDESGNSKLVNGTAIASLFKLFVDKLSCVVLNGCYSEIQAVEIAQHIPYVVGIDKEIGEQLSITFAIGFYDALGAGEDIDFAFRLGCASIQMEGELESEFLVFYRNGDLIYGNSKQSIEKPLINQFPHVSTVSVSLFQRINKMIVEKAKVKSIVSLIAIFLMPFLGFVAKCSSTDACILQPEKKKMDNTPVINNLEIIGKYRWLNNFEINVFKDGTAIQPENGDRGVWKRKESGSYYFKWSSAWVQDEVIFSPDGKVQGFVIEPTGHKYPFHGEKVK